MVTISADVPNDLLDQFDNTVDWRESNRSEQLRNAMRLWLALENPDEMLTEKATVEP